MAHVVTERCVECRYVSCARVCPVDCFVEVTEPRMLVIDPDLCIDCRVCVPACPVHAIWPREELPSVYGEWLARNAELAPHGHRLHTSTDLVNLPGALTLEQVQARERARGFSVTEPSDA
ncbi:MAG: ferredoxin family protein [Planctomycetota bacterium]